MKKHLLAIAALAVVSGTVAAQNVTVYGALDGGIEHQSRDAATGKSITKFGANNLQATVWGFRGTEDLGGGLKAGFNLESYVNTNDGSRNAFTTGSNGSDLFSRAANISLEGSVGKVVVGRQLDPAFLTGFAATDPRGARERNSGLITWATGARSGTNTNQHANIFDSNAVSYYGGFGGLNVGLGYAFGGVAGDTTANSVTTVGANYSNSGVTVSGSYSQNKGATANATSNSEYTRWSTGIGYKVGAVNLKANYMKMDVKNSSAVTISNNKTYGVGAEYQADAKNLVSVAYYDSKNDKNSSGANISGDTSKTWIISDEYSLSKRTVLYATYSNNKGGTNFSQAADMLYTSAGKTNNVTQVGIVHKF